MLEVENGCHSSQWPMRAKLQGSLLVYVEEWLDVLKQWGQTMDTSDVGTASLCKADVI